MHSSVSADLIRNVPELLILLRESPPHLSGWVAVNWHSWALLRPTHGALSVRAVTFLFSYGSYFYFSKRANTEELTEPMNGSSAKRVKVVEAQATGEGSADRR
jgi:hypothetical protein